MSLKLYTLDANNLTFTEVSAGTFEQAIDLSLKPGGSPITRKLYLRNSDDTKWFDDIVIKPTSLTGSAIVDGSIVIKLLSGDKKPTEEEWAAASANDNATLSSPIAGGPVNTRLPEIGNSTTADTKYYPLWIRVSANKSVPIGESRFSIQISYTENVI